MKFVHLKQFLGIEMISGVLKNRLSGLDDSKWFKNTAIDTFFRVCSF